MSEDFKQLPAVELRRLARIAQEQGDTEREIVVLRHLKARHPMAMEAVFAERRLRELGASAGDDASLEQSERQEGAPVSKPSAPSAPAGTARHQPLKTEKIPPFNMPSDSYVTSITLANIIKGLGWVVVFIGVVAFFVIIAQSMPSSSRYGSADAKMTAFFGGLVVGGGIAFSGLVLVLIAEAALAVFDIANNSRKSLAVSLHQLNNGA